MLIFATALALAGEIELWTAEDFVENTTVKPNSDWTGGYSEDEWWSDGEKLYSITDDNSSEDAGYDGDVAAKNYIGRGATFTYGGVSAVVETDDDDTVGIVLSAGDRGMFLAGWTRGSAPVGVTGSGSRLFIIRQHNATYQELANVEYDIPWRRYDDPKEFELRFDLDGTLTFWVDGEEEISVQANPIPVDGVAGAYAYDAGWDGGSGATFAGFDDFYVYLTDWDDDGVADDSDNCGFDANADQSDVDNDGIGDVCDPVDDRPVEDDPIDDDPIDDPEVDDEGNDPEVFTGNLADDYPEEALRAACGCQGAPGGAWLMLPALLLLRRRA